MTPSSVRLGAAIANLLAGMVVAKALKLSPGVGLAVSAGAMWAAENGKLPAPARLLLLPGDAYGQAMYDVEGEDDGQPDAAISE